MLEAKANAAHATQHRIERAIHIGQSTEREITPPQTDASRAPPSKINESDVRAAHRRNMKMLFGIAAAQRRERFGETKSVQYDYAVESLNPVALVTASDRSAFQTFAPPSNDVCVNGPAATAKERTKTK